MKNKELKIGIFVVTVLVATFFIINYLRGEDIFNREIDLKARYANVEGLLPSAPVFIKGYKAGSVASVEYLPKEDLFEVTCSVPKEFFIPADSRLIIYSVDIMGGKGIRVDAGASSAKVEDGAMLEGGYEPDLMSSLGSSIGPLMAKVTTVMDSLTVTVSGINSLLGEDNRESLASTLKHLQRTSVNAERLSASINGKSAELVSFIDNLDEVAANFASIASKADTTMTLVNGVASQLNGSDIRSLVSSFNSLLAKLQDPDGSLGRLMSEDSVYNDIDSLLSDIDSLIREIEKNPKKYIRISIF